MKRFFILMLTLSLLICGCQQNNSDADTDGQATSADNSSDISEEIPLKELADTVLDSVEFPNMQEVTMQEMLDMIINFSDYGITDKFVYQQTMSVHLCEIVIVRTTDVSSTLSALKERRKKLVDQLAFYPEQQESAEASVVGSKGNVCYLICHKDASVAEKALINKIS